MCKNCGDTGLIEASTDKLTWYFLLCSCSNGRSSPWDLPIWRKSFNGKYSVRRLNVLNMIPDQNPEDMGLFQLSNHHKNKIKISQKFWSEQLKPISVNKELGNAVNEKEVQRDHPENGL